MIARKVEKHLRGNYTSSIQGSFNKLLREVFYVSTDRNLAGRNFS